MVLITLTLANGLGDRKPGLGDSHGKTSGVKRALRRSTVAEQKQQQGTDAVEQCTPYLWLMLQNLRMLEQAIAV